MRIFRTNIKNDKVCSSIFAIFTYIGCTTINVLLELNFYPVTRRGFFCNDNSIKYPYQEQTVSSRLNALIHFGVAIATFIIGEFNHTCAIKKPTYKEGYKISKSIFGNHRWYVRAIKLFMMCVWCSTQTLMLTSIIKTEVGWLRPNFLAVCNPNITCTANSTKFHEDYVCLGTKLIGEWKRISGKLEWNVNEKSEPGINQARRSFPSGHASSSAAFASFNILYIEKRIKPSNEYVLLKPFVQLIWVCISAFVAFSRVKDYYHHLQDVIFGAILGSSVSLLAGKFCMKWLLSISVDKFTISNKVHPNNVKVNANKIV